MNSANDITRNGSDDPGMVRVFGSFEETMEFITERNRIADMHALLWQEQLRPGDCYAQWADDLIVYGEILPMPEDSWPKPGPMWRYVRGFSAAERDGEEGTVHVASVAGAIGRATFARARSLGWPSDETAFAALVAGDPRWRPTKGR